jgi:hypothetical protein
MFRKHIFNATGEPVIDPTPNDPTDDANPSFEDPLQAESDIIISDIPPEDVVVPSSHFIEVPIVEEAPQLNLPGAPQIPTVQPAVTFTAPAVSGASVIKVGTLKNEIRK